MFTSPSLQESFDPLYVPTVVHVIMHYLGHL